MQRPKNRSRFATAFALANPSRHPVFTAVSKLPDGIDAIIAVPFNAFAVGQRPDMSNECIAKNIAICMSRFGDAPFFGQFEHTSQMNGFIPKIPEEMVIQAPHSNGDARWVKSHMLMQWIADQVFALNKGNTVILVCHPDHARRCAILAMHYGLNPICLDTRKSVPYDSRKRLHSQWWCRSRKVYLAWEYLARTHLVMGVCCGKLDRPLSLPLANADGDTSLKKPPVDPW